MSETSKPRPPTVNLTKLGCGASLGDVPADATLYLLSEGGGVTVIPNSCWNIGLIGEAPKDGPRFEVQCDGHNWIKMNDLYFDRQKTYVEAARRAGKVSHEKD